MSAAIRGDISPVLFSPSVRRMTTLLLALLSERCATALAMPMPIAVPGWMTPLACSSQLTLRNMLSSTMWSVVSGHCVKASPPKSVRPMLSAGRLEMKLSATSFAALSRLGRMSGVSMLVEMSIAIMMSMPSDSPWRKAVRVCGRASITTRSVKDTAWSQKGI